MIVDTIVVVIYKLQECLEAVPEVLATTVC